MNQYRMTNIRVTVLQENTGVEQMVFFSVGITSNDAALVRRKRIKKAITI